MRRAAIVLCLCLALPAAPRAQDAPVEEVPPDAAAYLAPHLAGDADDCLGDLRLRRNALPQPVAGAAEEPPPLRRLVLAVDASGSMAGTAGGQQKMTAARRAAREFLRDVPPGVEVGLLVFGHRGNPRQDGRAASCSGVEVLRAPAPSADRQAIAAAIEGLRPVGWTPLAAAIEEAGRLFAPTERPPGEQVLLIVSDGVETCGGDPVAAAARLHGGPVRLVVNIVGFDIAAGERARLEAVAAAGGGRFEAAANGVELARRMNELRLARARQEVTARVTASRDATQARIAVSRAATNARICVSRLRTGELVSLNRAIVADSVARRLPPEVAREARRLLDERHRRIGALLDDYVSAVEGARDAQLDRIDADLREALGSPR